MKLKYKSAILCLITLVIVGIILPQSVFATSKTSVTFCLNGGVVSGSSKNIVKTVDTNCDAYSALLRSVKPTRKGYEFAGWYSDLDVKADSKHVYSKVYAHWDPYITFHYYDFVSNKWKESSVLASKYAEKSGYVNLINPYTAALSKNGIKYIGLGAIERSNTYNFIGWTLNPSNLDFLYAENDGFVVDEPVDLYDVWAKKNGVRFSYSTK